MTRRIEAAFARTKAEKRAAFIPFIMAGDPSLAACEALLNALPEAGADIIELGIPFSDPMADGPVIQEAGLRALAGGMTLKKTLGLAKRFRITHPEVPLILMGYYNPIHAYGGEAFAADAADAGVDGLILVDMPPEEEDALAPLLTARDISLVRLIAPTSLEQRLPKLLESARGYLYYISITGITGAASADAAKLKADVARLRAATKLPLAVGFGIKTPEQVAAIGAFTDGVVVGSAIVAEVMKHKDATPEQLASKVAAFVKTLRG
jgi:tryptophan synthase alpha chain